MRKMETAGKGKIWRLRASPPLLTKCAQSPKLAVQALSNWTLGNAMPITNLSGIAVLAA